MDKAPGLFPNLPSANICITYTSNSHMPSKGKKLSDKETLWNWVNDVEPSSLSKNHVEFVYKVAPSLTFETDADEKKPRSEPSPRRKVALASKLSNGCIWQNAHLKCR